MSTPCSQLYVSTAEFQSKTEFAQTHLQNLRLVLGIEQVWHLQVELSSLERMFLAGTDFKQLE